MYEDLIEVGPSWETIPSEELEHTSRDRLHMFREALHKANQSGFHIVNDDLFETKKGADKPLNTAVQSELEREIRYEGNTFYLSPDHAWLGDRGPDSFSVLRTSKAETSAHGVFFGILKDSATQRGLPVAVKPCRPEKPSKTYIDWIGNSLIARTNNRCFVPVGFLMDGGNTYSITELATNVETLDNSDWRGVLVDPQDKAHSGQRALLSDVGKSLAQLHTDNIVHGDTQFKNIAVDITGKTFFIDWESASFYRPDAPKPALTKPMAHDLKILVRSLACNEEEMGVGLLSGFSKSLKWEYFKRYIFDTYLEEFLKNDESETTLNMLAEVEEALRDYIFDERGLSATIKSIRNGKRHT